MKGFVGVNPAAARMVASALAGWSGRVDEILARVTRAEALSELDAQVAGGLNQVAANGRRAAVTITLAVDQISAFRIPAIAALHGRLAAPAPGAMGAIDTVAANRPVESADVVGRGDPGGTLTSEGRRPFGVERAGQPRAVAIRALKRMLTDTADPAQVRADEFEAILHDNGNVTLVLPGVIDLVPPRLGYEPPANSVRDLDQAALRSSRSTEVADNAYARLVERWVIGQIGTGAIERGAPVMIVGHSFGADTALDLAASRSLNGEWVEITHVVAAAYHSEPQLDHVASGTRVAVLQNIYDVPVLAEELVWDLAEAAVGRSGPSVPAGLARLAVEVVEPAIEHAVELGVGTLEDAINPALSIAARLGPLAVDPIDLGGEVEVLGDRIVAVGPGMVVAEFEGGFIGAGHHQVNYTAFLDRLSPDTALEPILVDIDRTGFTADGVTVAVDVSVDPDP